MRPPMPSRVAPVRGFPRVSGDAPQSWKMNDPCGGFSPRERGCAAVCPIHGADVPVFPA